MENLAGKPMEVQSATQEDRAGNVVDSRFHAVRQYKKAAKLELHVFTYSAPVRCHAPPHAAEDAESPRGSEASPGASPRLGDGDAPGPPPPEAAPSPERPAAAGDDGRGSSSASLPRTAEGDDRPSEETASKEGSSSTASAFRSSLSSGELSLNGIGGQHEPPVSAALIREAVARARESSCYKAGEQRPRRPGEAEEAPAPETPPGAALRETRPLRLGAGSAWGCATGRGLCGAP